MVIRSVYITQCLLYKHNSYNDKIMLTNDTLISYNIIIVSQYNNNMCVIYSRINFPIVYNEQMYCHYMYMYMCFYIISSSSLSIIS